MNCTRWVGRGVFSLTIFCVLNSWITSVAYAQNVPEENLAASEAIAPGLVNQANDLVSAESQFEAEFQAEFGLPLSSYEVSSSQSTLDTVELNVEEPSAAAIAEVTVDPGLTAQDLTIQDPLFAVPADSDTSSMGQITSVTQLSDVRPTDWAYQALQSLVERYGCIAGYPDGTYRGNQALTRFEFAAGLNACLDRINELIAAGLADVVTRNDLTNIQRLQEEFSAELATLRGRVDSLEARADELEANQFSTTTKLFGQVVLGVQGGNDYEFDLFLQDPRPVADTEPNVITNTQLSFVTQFDNRSILLVGLQAGDGNTNANPGLNDFTRLGYEGDNDHQFQISDLSFRHLIGDNFALIVGPEGVNAVNTFRGANRVESAGYGPLSRFAQRNPIINIGAGSGGVGFDWQLADWASLQGIYTTSSPEDPDLGLFGGDNGLTTLGAQLVISPSNTLDISFQYINSYSPFGRLFTGVGDDQLVTLNGITGRAPIQTNAFGANVEWQATPRFVLGGWFGFTTSDLLGQEGTVETTNWMAYLNFPDLFAEGNLGGLYFGQPPRITSSDLPDGRNIPSLVNEGNILAEPGEQPDTAYHLEAFYRWRLTNNITLTPGVVAVFNPGHNSENDTALIWALRTTFSF